MNAASRAAAGLEDDQVDLTVGVFRMLADATRIRLLRALVDDEVPVSALVERVGKPAGTVTLVSVGDLQGWAG